MKIVEKDGYVLGLSPIHGTEATEAECSSILSAIRSRPTPPAGYSCRLKADLTWEQYELPPEPESSGTDEITADEAMAILLGGAR